MMVLITYDVETSSSVGAKRLRKVAKECQNYGVRVQNSVFECVLTQAQATLLKSILLSIIDKEKDSIRFYYLGNNWPNRIETLGKRNGYDVTSELII